MTQRLGSTREEHMIRRLFIVPRWNPTLFEYLADHFSRERTVQVLLDRRWDERRRLVQRHEPERRAADRRRRQGLDDLLRAHGVVFIRCEGTDGS